MKYKIGQIFFWNSNEGLFGKAITYYNQREFNLSETTHCGIIAEVKDKVLIFEATSKGFISSYYEIPWLDEMQKVGKVHIGEVKQKMNNVLENCKKYKNIGYGWLDIIGISLHLLVGWKLLGLTGKNKLICSEAVSRIIYDSTKSVNIADEYNIVYDAVTPMHIFKSKSVVINGI